MLYVPPRAGTDRRKDELIIAASIGSVLCESSGGGQVDLFQQKKSLIPKEMQSWEPAKEKKERAQMHPDHYAHKEARNKKCMGSKSSQLAMISSRDKVNPEDVMSDFDSMPNNKNHDSLAHQEGMCNDFKDEEDPSMHDSEKDIGDDLENEAEFLKTEPCPQPSLTTPNEPGGGALFSGSKKFTINGGAYQAVNGDKYTTINNNNKPTFNTYKIYPGNKRYSPVPSYPPVVPCNPTFPSKRCPRRPRSRWNIITFTHMVNHHYLPAVMYYPMLWTGYIAPIYFPTCPWG
ncbi:hypothetical protein BT96DRAFT_39396 [Gymnopus androsaceus JB14]|uniref:Uncharacterized protein n=1 Tax=Gymnopus androsaceus JB14 TaxID=1447944 RepID=A0A6A4HJQ3_9AGAR|nr:hypothetical protein BT96DRAFT_39396 [Gymnopus androsaceus JB14]